MRKIVSIHHKGLRSLFPGFEILILNPSKNSSQSKLVWIDDQLTKMLGSSAITFEGFEQFVEDNQEYFTDSLILKCLKTIVKNGWIDNFEKYSNRLITATNLTDKELVEAAELVIKHSDLDYCKYDQFFLSVFESPGVSSKTVRGLCEKIIKSSKRVGFECYLILGLVFQVKKLTNEDAKWILESWEKILEQSDNHTEFKLYIVFAEALGNKDLTTPNCSDILRVVKKLRDGEEIFELLDTLLSNRVSSFTNVKAILQTAVEKKNDAKPKDLIKVFCTGLSMPFLTSPQCSHITTLALKVLDPWDTCEILTRAAYHPNRSASDLKDLANLVRRFSKSNQLRKLDVLQVLEKVLNHSNCPTVSKIQIFNELTTSGCYNAVDVAAMGSDVLSAEGISAQDTNDVCAIAINHGAALFSLTQGAINHPKIGNSGLVHIFELVKGKDCLTGFELSHLIQCTIKNPRLSSESCMPIFEFATQTIENQLPEIVGMTLRYQHLNSKSFKKVFKFANLLKNCEVGKIFAMFKDTRLNTKSFMKLFTFVTTELNVSGNEVYQSALSNPHLNPSLITKICELAKQNFSGNDLGNILKDALGHPNLIDKLTFEKQLDKKLIFKIYHWIEKSWNVIDRIEYADSFQTLCEPFFPKLIGLSQNQMDLLLAIKRDAERINANAKQFQKVDVNKMLGRYQFKLQTLFQVMGDNAAVFLRQQMAGSIQPLDRCLRNLPLFICSRGDRRALSRIYLKIKAKDPQFKSWKAILDLYLGATQLKKQNRFFQFIESRLKIKPEIGLEKVVKQSQKLLQNFIYTSLEIECNNGASRFQTENIQLLIHGKAYFINNDMEERGNIYKDLIKHSSQSLQDYYYYLTAKSGNSDRGVKIAKHNEKCVSEMQRFGVDVEQYFLFKPKQITYTPPSQKEEYEKKSMQYRDRIFAEVDKLALILSGSNRTYKWKGLVERLIKMKQNPLNPKKILGIVQKLIVTLKQPCSLYEMDYSGQISEILEKVRCWKKDYSLFIKTVKPNRKNRNLGKTLQIRLWNRDPMRDLFLGERMSCCLSPTGGSFHGVVERLIDLGLSVVEIVDSATGKPVALTWLFLAEHQGKAYLVSNFYEVSNSVSRDESYMYFLVNELAMYTAQFAKAINVSDYLIRGLGYGKVPDFEENPILSQKVSVKDGFELKKLGGCLDMNDGSGYFLEGLKDDTFYIFNDK